MFPGFWWLDTCCPNWTYFLITVVYLLLSYIDMFFVLETSLMKSISESTEWDNESSGSGGDDFIGFVKNWADSDSCYSSDSSNETSLIDSPVPDDTNSKLSINYSLVKQRFFEK